LVHTRTLISTLLADKAPSPINGAGVEYGEDYEKVKAVLERIIAADERILTTPAPFIGLGALSASSVDIKVRVWTKTENYWDVYFDMNKIVYDTFNKEGIGFPFPQLTVHQAKD
jgi:small conductance mechanosensitive channel